MINLTLMHEGNNVREFYSRLPRPVLVGVEATGSMHWFLNLMDELGIERRVPSCHDFAPTIQPVTRDRFRTSLAHISFTYPRLAIRPEDRTKSGSSKNWNTSLMR